MSAAVRLVRWYRSEVSALFSRWSLDRRREWAVLEEDCGGVIPPGLTRQRRDLALAVCDLADALADAVRPSAA